MKHKEDTLKNYKYIMPECRTALELLSRLLLLSNYSALRESGLSKHFMFLYHHLVFDYIFIAYRLTLLLPM